MFEPVAINKAVPSGKVLPIDKDEAVKQLVPYGGAVTYRIYVKDSKVTAAGNAMDQFTGGIMAGDTIEIINRANTMYHTFFKNGDYEFIYSDQAGNVSYYTVEVKDIDSNKPNANVTYSPDKSGGYTNKDVVVTITPYDIDAYGKQTNNAYVYWNRAKYQTESGSNVFIYTATENGNYQFVVMDDSGNTSTKEVVVDWIDKEAPVIQTNGYADIYVTADNGKDNAEPAMETVKKKVADLKITDNIDGNIPVSDTGRVTVEYYLRGEGDPVVDNTYLEVTVKKDGKGFGIYTKEGHPLKKTDNNKPLLYSGDDGFATSYTTIRIKHPDGSIKDYIYGNSYGFMGINSRFIEAPRAGSTSSSYYITSVWEVEKVAIRQTIELSTNAANGEAGYTVIRYEYTNNSGEDLEIGVRIMLDTQIADNDGGYFFIESNLDAVSVEKVYSGDNVPSSFRVQDKVTIPSTIAYGSVSGDNIRKPDAVQVGH